MTLSARFPQFPSLTEFRQGLDVGAFVFASYILVFVWQYFSVISGNMLAWALAVIVSLLIWYISVATKVRPPPGKLSLWFWLSRCAAIVAGFSDAGGVPRPLV